MNTPKRKNQRPVIFGNAKLHRGNCESILPTIPSQSIHGIISDPPYPEIARSYGKLTEAEWFDLMKFVVGEAKRILVPTGSAVFILQPNSRHIGSMRPWLWDFLSWVSREWNVIQDVYSNNPSTPPNAHANRKYGLMRPSVKTCVWLGSPHAFRNQDAVLLPLSPSTQQALKKGRAISNALHYSPSGHSIRRARMLKTAAERGGSTPYNLLTNPNTDSKRSSGAWGHGAGTALKWCDWWVRYITEPGQTVLDPFAGVSSVGEAALSNGRHFIGIEKTESYYRKSIIRLSSLNIGGIAT